MDKEIILIVDDSEMNRSILADILGENYDIVEAEDGVQAVDILQQMGKKISLVMLDMVMPNMDGIGVLHAMNDNHWIEDIPVIMVSADKDSSRMEQVYELGVTDFIARPFDTFIVRHRVVNTLLIYAKQKRLIKMIEEEMEQRKKQGDVMVDILSHIVETRNGESGQHVLHVRTITDFLLRKLRQKTDIYPLTDENIMLISNASALHDIGKMAVDEKILNKPGRLTDEEFEIMKSHSLIGAQMLEGETVDQDNPLVKTAYEICRWHHERYDGRGYPDGLRGDEIPISAQVVAMADVYDALTSVRVYKAAYDHETAIDMIVNGKCGIFNPLLIECLKENADELKNKLEDDLAKELSKRTARLFADAAVSSKIGSAS